MVVSFVVLRKDGALFIALHVTESFVFAIAIHPRLLSGRLP